MKKAQQLIDNRDATSRNAHNENKQGLGNEKGQLKNRRQDWGGSHSIQRTLVSLSDQRLNFENASVGRIGSSKNKKKHQTPLADDSA